MMIILSGVAAWRVDITQLTQLAQVRTPAKYVWRSFASQCVQQRAADARAAALPLMSPAMQPRHHDRIIEELQLRASF